jgi:hypothetical protein
MKYSQKKVASEVKAPPLQNYFARTTFLTALNAIGGLRMIAKPERITGWDIAPGVASYDRRSPDRRNTLGVALRDSAAKKEKPAYKAGNDWTDTHEYHLTNTTCICR